MKILATVIACTAILASPVYAAATHAHRTVAAVKHPARAPAILPSGGVFLLENRPPVSAPSIRDFQDNFSIDY